MPFWDCWTISPALLQPVLLFLCVCTAMTFMVFMAMLAVLGENHSTLSLLFFILCGLL